MACCAIFVFLIGSVVGFYRWLFRRGPETSFAPVARRAAPGIPALAASTSTSSLPVKASRPSRWRHALPLVLFLMVAAGLWHLGHSIFIGPAHASASSLPLTQSAAWQKAEPYSALWCSVICSSLCPRQASHNK